MQRWRDTRFLAVGIKKMEHRTTITTLVNRDPWLVYMGGSLEEGEKKMPS